jgi:D-hexose-6-phosphate mutarotase
MWDYNFEYRFDVTLRDECLEWDVVILNKGTVPFECTLGLHTYIDVSAIDNIVINGPFQGISTVDRISGKLAFSSSNELKINAPIDMLYKNAKGPVTITDSKKGTITTIESKGFNDWAIWNPYGNQDMGYDKFVCVEPVCATPISIQPGDFKETKFEQRISLKRI